MASMEKQHNITCGTFILIIFIFIFYATPAPAMIEAVFEMSNLLFVCNHHNVLKLTTN